MHLHGISETLPELATLCENDLQTIMRIHAA